MASGARTITRDIIEREDVTLYSREVLPTNAQLNGDDVQLGAWYLYDEADPVAPAVASGMVDPSTSVFDTLQTGPEWAEDAEGYNLRVKIPGAHLTRGGTTYRVEVILHLWNTEDTDERYAQHTVQWFLRTRSRRTG